jgi:ERCC4-type nuclease
MVSSLIDAPAESGGGCHPMLTEMDSATAGGIRRLAMTSNALCDITSSPSVRQVGRSPKTASPGGTKGHRRDFRRKGIPADLSAVDLVAIVDSREQNPLDLQPLRQVTGTLTTGDYSLRGLESIIAIERKSLPDLLTCVGQERDRFHREVLRLLAYPVRALVVESTWPELERGQWRSKVGSPAALGTVLNWVSLGLPVIMAGDHDRAGRYVSRILFVAARRRWREARSLLPLS